jgi:hypothetical protein
LGGVPRGSRAATLPLGTYGNAEAARRLAAKLVAGELPTPFPSWQVWRPGWSGLSDRAVAQAAIDVLVDLDWLREEAQPTSGRRKTLYHLNPRLREMTDALA